jgi:hypothetical protein
MNFPAVVGMAKPTNIFFRIAVAAGIPQKLG